METLIFNGSPRSNGDTAALLTAAKQRLKGEIRQIDVFGAKISPCTDCRRCRREEGCHIQDEMQEIYAAIARSDRLLVAAPVWFGALPGPLLTLASRLQCCFHARQFRGEQIFFGKKGGVILTAGGSGGLETACFSAVIMLRQMGAEGPVPLAASRQTDRLPAAKDVQALAEVEELARFLNE